MFDNHTPEEVTKEHKAELLEDSRWLDELSREQTASLAEFMDKYVCAPGTELLTEGADSSFMALITEGSARVLKLNKEKEEVEIAVLGEGKTFGEVSLIDKKPRSATIVAAQKCSLLVMTESKFKMLCEYKPEIALQITFQICSMLSRRLRSTSGKLVDHLDTEID